MIQTLTALFQKIVPSAEAATLGTSSFGIEASSGTLSLSDVMNNVINVGLATITIVCSAVFIAGAFFLASSAGNDQRKSLGKDLMIGAVMGLAIVAATKAILNIAYSFLYAI